MSVRNVWYMLALVALTMLPLAGCSGSTSTAQTTGKGVQLTVGGNVDTSKASGKTVTLAAGDANSVTVYDAQNGTALGTTAIDTNGKFSGLTFTLPSAKTILVFKAIVPQGVFRSIVPLDLSVPPAAGITASNAINIAISQESTNIATTVSAMLGLTGVLGDTGVTLPTGKTYADVAQQVVDNGGQVLAYNTTGLELKGSVASASLLPARDASTLSFADLNNMKFDAKIISAFIPGKNPIVNFQVTDKATGKGISGLKTFGLHIAKLVPETNGSSSYWVNYLDRGITLPAPLAFATTADKKQVTGTIGKPVADPGKTLVASNAVGIDFTKNPIGSVLIPGYTVIDKGDGSYTATFYSDVTSNTNAPYDASATTRIGVTVTTVAAPGVTATFPTDPATGSVNANIAANNRLAVVYDFVPATGAMLSDSTGKQLFARNLVPTEACNGCHTNIASILGHTARPNLLLCDICHTNSNTSGEAEMVTFIHRIHAGKNLPVAVVAENVANPTKLVPRPAVLVPYGTFAFPQDMRNCTVCHQGTEAAAWKTKPSKKNCGSCHNNVDFATHQGGQTDDKNCAACHGEGKMKDTVANHATDYSTPNNPQTPAGLVNFKYDLKTVAVDASNVATITFRILSDGGTGAAMAPVTLTAAGGLTGFTGGPSFLFAYSKTATNQSFSSSADYNNAGLKAAQPKSVALTAIATAGTLGTPDANGYYTATVSAAASGLTTGAKMRTVALQGYFTQVSPASGRHTISVVKTVTGDTARRVVIDAGKCGACHEVFEGHGGNRNIGKDTVGEAVCTLCHVPNLSSSGKGTNASATTFPASMTATEQALLTADGFTLLDPTTYPEETNNFKDMIHGIHAGSSRTTPLKFVRDRGSVVLYFSAASFKFPAVLKNCEACHVGDTGSGNSFKYAAYKSVPSNAQVTTDLTSDGTVLTLTNNVTAVSAARTSLPNAQDLVTTPFTASCVSCHDLATSKMHMKQNGGQIKVLRSAAVPANEACVTCHGVTGTASIYISHRF
ncbi:MAG TPA: OmcA/MtrC family decaheme c-type cytochrome [Desulfuromonadales bacterium]|nr:OmcA/MtrC family decaheme c-type cytochrome [Desulfuromonadales bacterium]